MNAMSRDQSLKLFVQRVAEALHDPAIKGAEYICIEAPSNEWEAVKVCIQEFRRIKPKP